MIRRIAIEQFLPQIDEVPLLDVRAPAEYAYGHIPGAHSLPLFSDEERAAVGTTYKQKGRDKAVLLGFDFVGTKWRGFIEQALKIAPEKRVFVHCWRGGMRSSAMAWALDFYGFDVTVLEGGYKAWRQWVLAQFELDYDLWVLGGMTGSHKTDILKALALSGAQVLDLERLAHHQGSAFGSMGKWTQPSQEHFENQLAVALHNLDLDRKIWVEDESRTIGKNAVPNSFWRQMQTKDLIELQVNRTQRVDYLAEEYGVLDKDFLAEKTIQIKKRLGLERMKLAIDAIEAGEMKTFVGIVLDYYDKAYQGCLTRRNQDKIFSMQLDYKDAKDSAAQVLAFVEHLNIK